MAIPLAVAAIALGVAESGFACVMIAGTYDHFNRTTSMTSTHTVAYQEQRNTYYRSPTTDKTLRVAGAIALSAICVALASTITAAYALRRRRDG